MKELVTAPLSRSPFEPLQRARRLSMLLWLLLAGMVLSGALAAGWLTKSRQPDTNRLLAIARPYFEGDVTATLIHRQTASGRYNSLGDLSVYGNDLADTLGLPAGKVDYQQGHPVYMSDKSSSSRHISLRVIGMDDQSAYWILRSEILTSAENVESDMEALRSRLESSMNKLNVAPKWNIILQGELAKRLDPLSASFLNLMRHDLHAPVAERYSDVRTFSWSFASPRFQDGVQSISGRLNTQIAAHRNSLNDTWRVTFGMPIITTEY